MRRWSLVIAFLAVVGMTGSFVAGPYLQGQAPAVVAAPKDVTSYRDIVKKILPAVVSIEVKAKPATKLKQQPGARRSAPLDDSQVPEEFRKFFEEWQGRPFEMPEDTPHQGFGSGFCIDPKGVILTNHHVVDGADQVQVVLKDGRKFVSTEIKSDAKSDIAIVRIDAKTPLPYLELGDSEAMDIGDRVLAVGAPFGLTGSVTAGIVSGKDRSLRMNMYEDFLQTDAAINPGNSGGPLVNMEGKVIGINSAIKSRSGGFQGVGLAVSSNMAKNVMTHLLKDGLVHRGYLGVQIKEIVDRDVAVRLGVDKDGGVLVGQVFPGAPAAKAGIQDGDVITSLAGKPIKEGRELQRTVAGLPLRQPVDVTVVRDSKPLTLKVTIDEQPQDFGSARVPVPRTPKRERGSISLDKLGIEVADVTPELAEQLGFKGTPAGAVVTQVERDGLASGTDLRRGMLIVKVNKQPIKSAADFRDAANKASLEDGLFLQVQSPQGGTSFIVLKAETVK